LKQSHRHQDLEPGRCVVVNWRKDRAELLHPQQAPPDKVIR
jgi:hypothetical protein